MEGQQIQTLDRYRCRDNIGYFFGTLAVYVLSAFMIGAVVDFARARSRRKSVLDPSTFEEPEFVPEVPFDPNRRNNFIARYWRGEYTLGISYWWFGFVGNIAVRVLIAGIAALFQADRGYDPYAIFVPLSASGWSSFCSPSGKSLVFGDRQTA